MGTSVYSQVLLAYCQYKENYVQTAVFMCKALGVAPDEKIEMLMADCFNFASYDSVIKYYPYLTKTYKEYLLGGTDFGTGNVRGDGVNNSVPSDMKKLLKS